MYLYLWMGTRLGRTRAAREPRGPDADDLGEQARLSSGTSAQTGWDCPVRRARRDGQRPPRGHTSGITLNVRGQGRSRLVVHRLPDPESPPAGAERTRSE